MRCGFLILRSPGAAIVAAIQYTIYLVHLDTSARPQRPIVASTIPSRIAWKSQECCGRRAGIRCLASENRTLAIGPSSYFVFQSIAISKVLPQASCGANRLATVGACRRKKCPLDPQQRVVSPG